MARPLPRRVLNNGLSYSFTIIGGAPTPWWDLYHSLLRVAWWQMLSVVVAVYVSINVAFASLYMVVGGVANARPGNFEDAFYFSVQTLGTIGYGSMYPASHAANALMAVESVVGLLVTAFATGLVFVRFSRVRGRILFSERLALSPMDGRPTLMLRLGNLRRNRIYDAEFRLTLSRTRRSAEGMVIYKSEELKLVRDRAPTLQQSWMVLHTIDEGSPLHGETPESLLKADAEISVAVTGVDDASLQPVHGRQTWETTHLVWGARLVDVLKEDAQGNVEMDLSRFHDLEPTVATAEFPYPEPAQRA